MPANATLNLPRSSKLPSLLPAVSGAALLAGSPITAGQGLQSAGNGYAYPITCANTAAVADAGSAIFTPISANTGGAYFRGLDVSQKDGSIYYLYESTDSFIQRLGTGGAAAQKLDLGASYSSGSGYSSLTVLASGNVVFTTGGGNPAKLGVYDSQLNQKRALANYDGGNAVHGPFVIPQAKGGFAAVHFDTATLNLRMAYFDDNGSQLVAPFTIKTLAASANAEIRGVEQVSGNITVAAFNSAGTDSGLWSAVYDKSGVLVTAAAKLTTDNGGGVFPNGMNQMAVLGNISAVTCASAVKLFILNAAGGLAATCVPTGMTSQTRGVAADPTTNSFFVVGTGGGGLERVSRVDTTGAEKQLIWDAVNAIGSVGRCDAICGDGFFASIRFDATNANLTGRTYDQVLGTSVNMSFDGSGTAAGLTGSAYLGDGAFVATGSDGAQKLAAFKGVNMAIEGIALEDAGGPGNRVIYDNTLPKGYAFNLPIRGNSGVVAFDHTTNNQKGRKGAISSGGLYLSA